MVAAKLSLVSPTQLQIIELVYLSRTSPLEIALRLGQRLDVVRAGLQDGMSQLCRLFRCDFPIN
jgi:DNA-directed RNA polymerase specialized sigma24 family protein